ncbi:MAG: cytidine deaminase [Lachnospiraceae bacterium]|nr:cytidine deaminase [Lachnospiraceae bacterium]
MNKEELIKEAIEARKTSYSPYSDFKVGAALCTRGGRVIRGSNIENASYGLSNCAERTAIFKAVSEGFRDFEAIAIIGGTEDGDETEGYAYPCGACRQVMREFCIPETFKVIVARSVTDYKEYTLKELFPDSFGPDNL